MTSGNPLPWLNYARDMAIQLARQKGDITINDVRQIAPPPDDLDPRVMGGVFSRKLFDRVGYKGSERAHGRPIGIFRLRQQT